MLALLPLRGWAVAAMDLPSAMPASAHAMADDGVADAALPPCHDAGDAGGDGRAAGICLACDWCHASLALPARVTLAAVAQPAAPPRLAAARDTGRRLAGGVDRPPRSPLA